MTDNILKTKYRAQIFESRYSFHRTVPLEPFNYSENFYDKIPIVTERGIEINLDPIQYELLLRDLEFLDNISANGIRDHLYAEQVLHKEKQEKELRAAYPALDDAFKKYQTLLILLSNGKN